MELDLVFWDTTSTYFEDSGPEDLAKYGFSKDKRPDWLQIVIGVLMTKEGIPVAHQIFPGNTNNYGLIHLGQYPSGKFLTHQPQ